MSLRLVFACLSITTSRNIRVRAPDRVSLGLIFVVCLLPHREILGLGLHIEDRGHIDSLDSLPDFPVTFLPVYILSRVYVGLFSFFNTV